MPTQKKIYYLSIPYDNVIQYVCEILYFYKDVLTKNNTHYLEDFNISVKEMLFEYDDMEFITCNNKFIISDESKQGTIEKYHISNIHRTIPRIPIKYNRSN